MEKTYESVIRADQFHEDMLVEPSMETTQPTEEEVSKLREGKEVGKGGLKKGKVMEGVYTTK